MAESLDDVVLSAKTPESKTGVVADVASGTLCYTSSTLMGGFGMYLMTDSKAGLLANIVGGVITLVAFPLLFSLGCYFFTNPSDRSNYQNSHTWMPKRLTDYLNKKLG
jgi:hypothetical protein